jgi:hypothetical protein
MEMNDIKTISQLFEKFLSNSDNDKILIGELRCILDDILPIQGHINKIFIYDKIAYIRLTSSTLRHAIKLKKQMVIDRCHEKNLLIDDIVIY